MWNCKKCGEQIEDEFVVCWNCQADKDGSLPEEHQQVEETAAISYPSHLKIITQCPNPKCNKPIFYDHDVSWCTHCGQSFKNDILWQIVEFQQINSAVDKISDHKLDIQPLTLDAFIEVRGGGCGCAGKGELEVDALGMFVRPKGKGGLFGLKPIGVKWGALREFKNELVQKKSFVANFGLGEANPPEDKNIIVSVTLKDAAVNKVNQLASVFGKLPSEAYMRRCSQCSGPVEGDLCKNCGRSHSSQNRKEGVGSIIAGVVALAIGLVLTEGLSQGGIFLFYGLILLGIFLLLRGIVKLILGIRASGW